MGQVKDGPRPRGPRLFNSALETGVRTVFVLDASHPRPLDLLQLTWLDYLVVHTGDIGGPPSLHPDVPARMGELLVRRHLVQDGLNLVQRLHLVDAIFDPSGIRYCASDAAPAFIELMRAPYSQNLKTRAKWLMGHFAKKDDSAMERYISEKIGRWAVEFQGESDSDEAGL